MNNERTIEPPGLREHRHFKITTKHNNLSICVVSHFWSFRRTSFCRSDTPSSAGCQSIFCEAGACSLAMDRRRRTKISQTNWFVQISINLKEHQIALTQHHVLFSFRKIVETDRTCGFELAGLRFGSGCMLRILPLLFLFVLFGQPPACDGTDAWQNEKSKLVHNQVSDS